MLLAIQSHGAPCAFLCRHNHISPLDRRRRSCIACFLTVACHLIYHSTWTTRLRGKSPSATINANLMPPLPRCHRMTLQMKHLLINASVILNVEAYVSKIIDNTIHNEIGRNNENCDVKQRQDLCYSVSSFLLIFLPISRILPVVLSTFD